MKKHLHKAAVWLAATVFDDGSAKAFYDAMYRESVHINANLLAIRAQQESILATVKQISLQISDASAALQSVGQGVQAIHDRIAQDGVGGIQPSDLDPIATQLTDFATNLSAAAAVVQSTVALLSPPPAVAEPDPTA